MNKHKTKLFKKVFQNNADCFSDEFFATKGQIVEQAMTEDTFVPLMGEMWHKAKEKYYEETLEFATWFAVSLLYKDIDIIMDDAWEYKNMGRFEDPEKYKSPMTTKELFKFWKQNKKILEQ